MEKKLERLRVTIDGRVQGVGFRYATYRQAVQLGLAGWVRNRADGRVEALFEGTRDALEAMREWCEEGPRFANVTRVDEMWEASDGQHAGFQIID